MNTSFLRLVLELYWERAKLSQVLKTEGTRQIIMFCFSETIRKIDHVWLEGQVNTIAVAVMTRM